MIRQSFPPASDQPAMPSLHRADPKQQVDGDVVLVVGHDQTLCELLEREVASVSASTSRKSLKLSPPPAPDAVRSVPGNLEIAILKFSIQVVIEVWASYNGRSNTPQGSGVPTAGSSLGGHLHSVFQQPNRRP